MNRLLEFDDMVDPAFAEIYWTAVTLEKKGEIENDNDTTEDLSKKCKQIAVDYVNLYEAACKIVEPDFWEGLDAYAEQRLKSMYPLSKEFTVLIDANMTYEYKIRAHSREEAEQDAMNVMKQNPYFDKRFRENARVYDMNIGDIIEKN